MEKKELLEYFIDRDISGLYRDFSDDGDGELELTICGDEVAELIMELTDKAREEGRREAKREAQIEVLTEIFQTCYQEDSKTLELVEEKLSKLSNK